MKKSEQKNQESISFLIQILRYERSRNLELAVIEAKSDEVGYAEGIGQAKDYAEKLQLRLTYASDGKTIYEIDMQNGKEDPTSSFPTPDELWQRTFSEQNDWRDRFATVPFEDRSGTRQPRYLQDLTIQNSEGEAIPRRVI